MTELLKTELVAIAESVWSVKGVLEREELDTDAIEEFEDIDQLKSAYISILDAIEELTYAKDNARAIIERHKNND